MKLCTVQTDFLTLVHQRTYTHMFYAVGDHIVVEVR